MLVHTAEFQKSKKHFLYVSSNSLPIYQFQFKNKHAIFPFLELIMDLSHLPTIS